MPLLSDTGKDLLHEIRIFIKEVGFPIGVAIWLLWEAHTTIKDMTRTLQILNQTMIKVGYKIDDTTKPDAGR